MHTKRSSLEQGKTRAKESKSYKFGKTQSDLFKLFGERRNAVSVETSVCVDSIGFNLSFAEQNALFALQEIMSKRGYQGAIEIDGRPVYAATIAEYLEAYGVSKRATKRGKNEFFSNERQEALDALKALKERRITIFYKVKNVGKGGKVSFDTIKSDDETIVKILQRFDKLTPAEQEALEIKGTNAPGKKLSHLVFVPHRVLFDQIDSYFCLKDSEYRKKLRTLAGNKGNAKTSRYVGQFIDWLYYQAAHRRKSGGIEIRIGLEDLATKLRMTADIKKRNWKRIGEKIQEAADIAIKLEYITEHRQEYGQAGHILEVFVLNPMRFSIVKVIERKSRNTKEIENIE